MAQTLKFGNKVWAAKEDSVLAYNDINNNYKPLPFTFSRASIGTRVNKDGLIETMGQDIARIDYTDSADGVLLLEPASTNLVAYSENFAGQWNILGNVVVTNNFTTSPDGTQNASKLAFNGAGRIYYVVSSTSAVFSVYLKGENGKEVAIRDASGFITSIITLTDKWERYEVFINQSSSNIQIENINSTYVYAWGAQLEALSYPTSYIPTSGSTVTRAAETCNNSGNSEVFNDSEGVLFANIASLDNSGSYRVISVSDGTASNRMFIELSSSSGNIAYNFIVANVSQSLFTTNLTALLSAKIALKYSENNFALWVNGLQIYTDTSGITFSGNTLNKLSFNDESIYPFYGKTKEIGYYDTALTDAELETLTSYRNWVSMVNELNLNIIYNG